MQKKRLRIMGSRIPAGQAVPLERGRRARDGCPRSNVIGHHHGGAKKASATSFHPGIRHENGTAEAAPGELAGEGERPRLRPF
jgi:hypothetical protein